MLGTFRLVLALMVAVSHAGPRRIELGPSIASWLPNPGVVAVIGFYLISGYVMTGLLRRYYWTKRLIPDFWIDRALRLYPQYIAIGGITLLWMIATGGRTDYLQRVPTVSDLLANLAIVPLNFYMFNGSDQFSLVPPAWSLGAEVQFYLVFPLLMLWGGRLPALLASLAVYLLAGLQIIQPDWYGFRLLPGVLFVFLLGSYLYDVQVVRTDRSGATRLVLVTVAGTTGFALLLAAAGTFSLSHTGETLLGLALGMPLLRVLGACQRRDWDERLGNLAYGVFLSHFFVQWAMVGTVTSVAAGIAYIGGVLAMSYLMQRFVERPVIAWRSRLRARRALPGASR